MLRTIHQMQVRDERGFTLVELLIVIAIIAILAAIAIPEFARYRERAAKASCVSDAKNAVNSCAANLADNPVFAGACTNVVSSPGSTVVASVAAGDISVVNTCAGAYAGACTYTAVTGDIVCVP